jgi:hypothetical protein
VLRVLNGICGCEPCAAMKAARPSKETAFTTKGPSLPRLRMMLTAEE